MPLAFIAFKRYLTKVQGGISPIQPCQIMDRENPYIVLSSISSTIKYYLVESRSTLFSKKNTRKRLNHYIMGSPRKNALIK
jgi:hypothetical protein